MKKVSISNSAFLFLAALCCALIFIDESFADKKNTDDVTPTFTSYDDGPHIFWRSDTIPIALYFIDGKFIHKPVFDLTERTEHSEFSFPGFAQDDTVLYTLHPAFNTVKSESVDGVSRILALSDIHGEYEYFVEILQNSRVIDSARHWIWGDGHLVIAGDIFDRGDKVNECLWLVYQLEQEANLAGGAVHFVIGNHELMVMRDDFRYVNEKYLEGIARRSRINYGDLYGVNFELGRWLRTKHTIVRINRILFMHGGISPALVDSGFTLSEINNRIREILSTPSAELLFNPRSRFLTSSLGPLWYRGFHYEVENRYQQSSSEDITNALSHFDADAIVVGHTGVDSVSGLYDNRVFALDIPFEDIHCIEALLWNENGFHRVLCSGELQLID